MAEWIIRDTLHPAAIDGAGFTALMKIAEPRYVLPSAQYFKTVLLDFRFIVLTLGTLLCFMLAIVFVQTMLPDLYDKMKVIQRNLLHDPSFIALASVAEEAPASLPLSSLDSFPCPNPHHPISFTVDLWSGPDHESYICLTAHWLDKQWGLNDALLDIYLCTDRHTGYNLAEWMKQIWKENEISVCWMMRLVRCIISVLLSY